MPIKHCLWRQGLIRSAECRLPLTRVSETLGRELDSMSAAGSDDGAARLRPGQLSGRTR